MSQNNKIVDAQVSMYQSEDKKWHFVLQCKTNPELDLSFESYDYEEIRAIFDDIVVISRKEGVITHYSGP